MPIFCQKCNSQLFDVTVCPICGTQVTNNSQTTEIKAESTQITSINPKTETQKKKLKKKIIRKKNKARKNAEKVIKRKQMPKIHKTTKAAIIAVSILLALTLIVSTALCTLVYFDNIDIPFVSETLHGIGLISDKNTKSIKVTDENSAIKEAKNIAHTLGFEHAADELTLISSYKSGELTNYELQQNHNGIPVFSKTIILCVDKHGNVTKRTANLIEINTNDTVPTIEYSKLVTCLYDNLRSLPTFPYRIDESDIIIDSFTNENLVYFAADNGVFLSYKLNITAIDKTYIYILNAHDGTIYYQEYIPPMTDATAESTTPDSTDTSTPDTEKIIENVKPHKFNFRPIILVACGLVVIAFVILIITKTKKKKSSASKYPKTF